VIYEIAKNLVDEKDPAKAPSYTMAERCKILSCFIRELKPQYCCRRDHLYYMECQKLKNDHPISYLSGHFLLQYIGIGIEELCEGKITQEHQLYIRGRQESLSREKREKVFSPPFKSKGIDFEQIRRQYLQNLINRKKQPLII